MINSIKPINISTIYVNVSFTFAGEYSDYAKLTVNEFQRSVDTTSIFYDNN